MRLAVLLIYSVSAVYQSELPVNFFTIWEAVRVRVDVAM